MVAVTCAARDGDRHAYHAPVPHHRLQILAQGKRTRRRRWIREQTLFVDYNLYAICRLMEVFPAHQDYLGLEIPYNALIRPIPRAIWPGKPEGLSYFHRGCAGGGRAHHFRQLRRRGVHGGGMIGVLSRPGLRRALRLVELSRFAAQFRTGHPHLCLRLFCTVISMRSLFVFTTALLPTVAAHRHRAPCSCGRSSRWKKRRAARAGVGSSSRGADRRTAPAARSAAPRRNAMRPRVAFVSVVPSPYQRDLFARSRARPEVELRRLLPRGGGAGFALAGEAARSPTSASCRGFWFALGSAALPRQLAACPTGANSTWW